MLLMLFAGHGLDKGVHTGCTGLSHDVRQGAVAAVPAAQEGLCVKDAKFCHDSMDDCRIDDLRFREGPPFPGPFPLGTGPFLLFPPDSI